MVQPEVQVSGAVLRLSLFSLCPRESSGLIRLICGAPVYIREKFLACAAI